MIKKKDKVILPVVNKSENGPAKYLRTKKINVPRGIPDHNLKEVERTVSEEEPPPLPINAKLNVIGKRVRRLDALYKVTGAAKYTADIQLPGMLYGKFVRSKYPHARISGFDPSRALALPGVRAIHIMGIETGGSVEMESGHEMPADRYDVDQFPVMRYVGQPIAGIAADSAQIAGEAVKLIDVEYDVMPFVVDLDEARKEGAPRVFDEVVEQEQTEGDVGGEAGGGQQGNLRGPSTSSFYGGPRGDVEKGFREADVIVDREFRTQIQTHCTLETHGVVADWKPDMLTVYASTQSTKSVRNDLMELFDLPASKVRVITEYMGAGFGAKFGAGSYGVMATWLSKKTGRPVKLMLDRKEEHMTAGNRPNSHQFLKIGAKQNGKLTAINLLSYGSAGVGLGAGVGRVAQAMYTCPNFYGEQYDVFMHSGPGAAFRAPGNVQGLFALEQVIDELAEKLGQDPLAYRDVIDPSEVRKVLRQRGAKAFGWKWQKPGQDTGPVKRGIGVAQGHWPRIIHLDSSATVKINKDGTVEILSGVQDIGTGTKTILAQVVAEEFGLRAEDITVKIGDTTYPDGPGSGGSVTAGSITPAARNAAHKAKIQLLEQMASAWDVDMDDIAFLDGKVIVSGEKDKMVSFKEAVRTMRTFQIMATASRSDDYDGFDVGNSIGKDRLGSVQFAEVTVDTGTGVIKVERVVAAHSCGRPLNPLQIESQVNGGVIMGVGYALYENQVMDKTTGVMMNANLDTYKLPYSREIPDIETILVEHYGGHSSTDASGIGEPANVATAAAIANAVYNAIGVRLYELPMTPDKVLRAMGLI